MKYHTGGQLFLTLRSPIFYATKKLLIANGFEVVAEKIVPDQTEEITATIIDWTDNIKIDLVLTTGGTGVSPADVTPEATRSLLDREIPGIGEAMRLASLAKTKNAILSRGIAGIRNKSLIINLPGSEKAARENIEAVLEAIPHAIYKIKGGMDDCGS
ncbi:MAG: MogA/MoaB family molybdenum cofactor biosynthesis protein [Proteobacteria bacterium]|nr:MogA/MoaB family molybdenum cofactor biosynthesis protein [Pseudomonadota bacterium]MBU1716661.1 MogA/MoaB family molybdenum cofactor biosynthesis protein [Pseudomonadota bacterium]